MSEFITIQVGQCGNQIGGIFWPHALKEYGVTNTSSNSTAVSLSTRKSFKSFFNCPEGLPKHSSLSYADLRKSKVTARAVLIDMEERVVDRFHQRHLNFLFDKRFSLTNYPGSGNNWAVGHHTHFQAYCSTIEDILRRSVEQCDYLHGILVLLSLGGGTGAGLGTAIVRQLEDLWPAIDRFVTCVHPGEYNDVVTGPYNVAHSLRVLTEHATCVIPADNKALSDICSRHQLNRGVKPYQDINNVIVNMLLNLTSGSRFSGSLNFDMSDLSTLVPQPGLNYFNASFSPLHLAPSEGVNIVNKKSNLLHDVCVREDQFLRVNALGGSILSAALLCRGDVSLSSLRGYIERFRSKLKFAAWSDPGVKAGLCSVPPIGHKSAMLCLSNSSNMANFFNDTLTHYDRLYKKKAHVHHYTQVDGMEDIDFELTRESILSSSLKYSEAAKCVEAPRFHKR